MTENMHQPLRTQDLAGTAPEGRRETQPWPAENRWADPDHEGPLRTDEDTPDNSGRAGYNGGIATESPASAGGDSERVSLLADQDASSYQKRWESVQISFVDQPRQAVEQADALVAEVMQQLARRFAEERQTLETHWSSGGDVGTEDLRVALQRYRSFFQRLLET